MRVAHRQKIILQLPRRRRPTANLRPRDDDVPLIILWGYSPTSRVGYWTRFTQLLAARGKCRVSV